MQKEKTNPNQVIRKKELLSLLKISDPSLWRWERAGKFPKRIQLGGASVGWLQTEISAWVEGKKAERSEK